MLDEQVRQSLAQLRDDESAVALAVVVLEAKHACALVGQRRRQLVHGTCRAVTQVGEVRALTLSLSPRAIHIA